MEQLITAAQAARMMDVSKTTMADWCKRGFVPGAQKVATVWLIPADSLTLIERPKMGRPTTDTKKPAK